MMVGTTTLPPSVVQLAIFVFIVAAALCLLPILFALGTLFTTRQEKSLTVATVYEAIIRSITGKLLLWCVYFVAPPVARTLAGFGTDQPLLTDLTLRFALAIRRVTGTPLRIAVLLFFCAAVVAMLTAVFHQLGSDGLNHSRRFSLIVSAVTFSGLGLMAIALVLPFIKLLNDLS